MLFVRSILRNTRARVTIALFCVLISGVYVLVLTLFILPFVAYASETDGTIDSTSKYAWGDELGWINFGNTNGNVHVTDSVMTGYAWSENFGWINLAPTNSGVANDSEGDLSGYAWGENIGWIGFGSVSINSSGVFAGTATSSVGSIVFDCDNCAVTTDWRPASSRTTATTPAQTAPVGGGTLGAIGYAPPESPVGGFRVFISNDADITTTRFVTLSLYGGPNTARMKISNHADFRDAVTELYVPAKQWTLAEGGAGERRVYVIFMTQYFGASDAVSDAIMYSPEFFARVEEISEEAQDIISRVPDILRNIPADILEKISPNLLKALPDVIVRLFPFLGIPTPGAPIEIGPIVTPEAPPSLKARWVLIPPKPLRELALRPLPSSIGVLAQKIPEFGKTLESVGISKLNDLSKLRSVTLSIPVLSEIARLTPLEPELQKFSALPSLPVGNLPLAAKELIPSGLLFVRSGGGLLDLPLSLNVTEEGVVQQSIDVVAGDHLTLVVKPEYTPRSIIGFLLFNSRSASEPQNESVAISFENELVFEKTASARQSVLSFLSLREPVASLLSRFSQTRIEQFASPLLSALPQSLTNVEDRLVLEEFEYTDPDGDNIYTAEIDVPPVSGEYEIITIITYEDPDLGTKALRLTTVIDPEGYIYEQSGGKEIRIPRATVSMYAKNAEGMFALWLAGDYGQENPQITGVSGNYAFLVPEGEYYITVEARGYLPYQGKPFVVRKASGSVHTNILMSSRYWWLTAVDWKTLLLFFFALLLLYNFYRDRVREAHLAEQNH